VHNLHQNVFRPNRLSLLHQGIAAARALSVTLSILKVGRVYRKKTSMDVAFHFNAPRCASGQPCEQSRGGTARAYCIC
jgi:hypothetical protein